MASKEPRTPAGPAPCLHPNRRACIQRSVSPAPPHPGATPTPHVETTTWRAGRPSGVTGQAPARGQEGRGPQDHRLLLGRSPPSSSLRLCSLSVLGRARQACTSPQVCTRLPGCAHISPGVHRSPQVCTHLPGCAHVSPGVHTSPRVCTRLPRCAHVSPGVHVSPSAHVSPRVLTQVHTVPSQGPAGVSSHSSFLLQLLAAQGPWTQGAQAELTSGT